MQIHIAKTIDDVARAPELAESETWGHARNFLKRVGKDPFADHLRWLEDDGRPVACVQIFLHQYPIGRATVGMCLPEYPFVPPELRGRGHFRRLMADLFQWMRGNGYPLAYSHGRKGLYTHIGYAPCLHHCTVLIRIADAVKVQAPGRAEPATDGDVTANEALFRRPFPLGRGLQCRDEQWRPAPDCVRLATAAGGEVRGFVVLGQVLVVVMASGIRPAQQAGAEHQGQHDQPEQTRGRAQEAPPGREEGQSRCGVGVHWRVTRMRGSTAA